MANMLENYGLDFFAEQDNGLTNLVGYICENAKAIPGYHNCPHLFLPVGNPEFWLSTVQNEDGRYSIDRLNTHSGNRNIWKLVSTGIDITPKDATPTEKTICFKKLKDGTGLLPIEIITADVLPSYLENEVVEVQVEGLPLEINYYENEEDYAAHAPQDNRGKKWGIADGALFAGAFLYNHDPYRPEEAKDYSHDSCVFFSGTVKGLYHGVFDLGGEKTNTFIRCLIDTEFGELELSHTLAQIPEAQRDNLHPGAYVFGTCIISGDVAVHEYENGIVRNHENNVRLFRDVIETGDATRLRNVLADTSEYYSETSNEGHCGIDDIVDWMIYVREHRKGKVFTYLATITEYDGNDCEPEYPVGTRCAVIAYDEPKNYQSVVFMEEDAEGRITKIYLSQDSRYHFKVDESPVQIEPAHELHLYNEIEGQMVARAKFMDMLDHDYQFQELLIEDEQLAFLNENADNMIAVIKDFSPERENQILQNVFGYLFAKAIEAKANEDRGQDSKLIVSYCLPDAFAGIFHSSLSEENHQKLSEAMKDGKKFFLDYMSYIDFQDVPEERYPEVLKHALVAIQKIGRLYCDVCLGKTADGGTDE